MAHERETLTISDDDTPVPLKALPKKRKIPPAPPIKVEWSDDPDNTYDILKKRLRSRTKSAPSARKKGKAKAGSGDKHRHASPATKSRQDDDTNSDTDPDLVDHLIPDHIQQRRREFDHGHGLLRNAGLQLPPDYSDIYFSDDERVGRLDAKPQFDPRSGIKPSQPLKDIVLQKSGGIIPASIAQYLRDYQIKGVEFLHQLFVYQKGGILGDDMGLGKTVQVAAFLTAAFGKTGDCRDAKRMRKYRRSKDDWYPRALIVCPGSLIQNWRNELDRWGWWEVDIYHGAGRDDVLGAARAGRLEVMITTYTTYKNSCTQINMIPWDVIVADECHSIKDPSAGVTKAMNQVNALCRIGLTGTAIQNRYEELWTLLNWTNPARFGSRGEWKNRVRKPLTVGQSHDATVHQLSMARMTAQNLRDNLLPQFFLRRMKSLIAHQLPKKSDKVVFCPLSKLQQDAYESLLDSDLVNFVRSTWDECPCGSGKKRGWCCFQKNENGETMKQLVFPIVMTLQKLSNHLNLIIPHTLDIADKHEKELRFLRSAAPTTWRDLYDKRESMIELANPERCGKWKVLRKLLKFWHGNGDKVLVFSHSVRLLRILHQLFANTSYSVSYLDGSLNYEERQQIVDDFNSDPSQFVFLISTKAGGVGLNITSANKVVVMDPHWNPSYDLQAQDRAYRIGQVRDVEVYRLVSTGTIEEVTYARQIYKQQQANIGYSASNERRYFKGVQEDSDRRGEIFGIQNLLTYNGASGLLRDIVNKTNVAEARVGVRLVDVDMEKAAKEEDYSQFIKKEEGAEDLESGGLKSLSNFLTRDDNKSGTLEPKVVPKAKNDPIQGILASEGVEYTHENSEVVGSSKIEDEISRQAMMAVGEDGPSSGQALFYNREDTVDHDLKFFDYKYNPPEEVLRRQFCTMSQTFGFANVTEFALAVETMTQEGRRNCLELFYKRRMEKMKEMSGVATDRGGTGEASETQDDGDGDQDVQDRPVSAAKREVETDEIKMEDAGPGASELKHPTVIQSASGGVQLAKSGQASLQPHRASAVASTEDDDDDESDAL
ncbi:P-loop containing nucleoside triphosphate hydrolase protein [Xylariomycetidae sp. FL2044]|nr:P-loop containing nucleoside triphosphate hydrolase protein [Xylariomycetidae sp. FL2044]